MRLGVDGGGFDYRRIFWIVHGTHCPGSAEHRRRSRESRQVAEAAHRGGPVGSLQWPAKLARWSAGVPATLLRKCAFAERSTPSRHGRIDVDDEESTAWTLSWARTSGAARLQIVRS